MGIEKGKLSLYSGQQEIDLISAVSELHGFSCSELSKLVRDSNNNIIRTYTKSGSCVEIDIEKLARYLALHLIAKLMVSDRDEELLKYLLCGIRLLHSLCEIAGRHPKLEQILVDDMKVVEQIIDLIFYLLAYLSNFEKGPESSGRLQLLHSALVACTLYLLTGCISSQWLDLATVLVAIRKVYVFMDVAFAAVHVDIAFLQLKLSGQSTDCPMGDSNAERILYYACQQCESSLQFLQCLCQQKSFREHFVKHKEFCVGGGVLLLAQAVLSLNVSPTYKELSSVIASVSRIKSRIISILSHLCEVDTYLDEVATSPQSMGLAKFVASKILVIINNIGRDQRQLSSSSDENYPTGHLELNALRLADILSDDSNFRSYMSTNFAKVLVPMILLPQQEFLSMWCASELSVWEKDANLEYDSFLMAGCILDAGSSIDRMHIMNNRCHLSTSNMSRASYSHGRTSLLVKVIANLHCFVPQLCEEKENLFLDYFLECLKEVAAVLPAPDAVKATIVKSNLRSLLSHAESLTPLSLIEEDVQLLRMFVMQCRSLIASVELEVDKRQGNNFEEPIYMEKLSQLSFSEHLQEDQNLEGCSPQHPITINGNGNLKECTSENSAVQEANQFDADTNGLDQTDERSWHVRGDEIREIRNRDTSGSDSGSTPGKSSNAHHNADFPNPSEHMECGFTGLKRSETVTHEESQRRRRKGTLMNDKQVSLVEIALSKEPDMQRNAASIQEWAAHLSKHGSEVTPPQLKNWLNNRKAKKAKAAKDSSVPSEGKNLFTDKGIGSHYDSSENPIRKGEVILPEYVGNPSPGFVQCKPGQQVVLIDGQGEEIGKAKVFQVQGEWLGFDLEESQMCVVDITELKVDEMNRVPYPCEATCATFYEARKKFGIMRILWGSNKTFMLSAQ